MKLALMLLVPAAITASAQMIQVRATACGAGNNCARGVAGTAGVRPPLSSRMADCTALNIVTVTPAVFTSTSTIPTIYPATSDPAPAVPAITVTPSSVPTYATYCSSASAYYSACSCAGATPVTTTVATPTVTVTQEVCMYSNFADLATENTKRAVKRGMDMYKGVLNYAGM